MPSPSASAAACRRSRPAPPARCWPGSPGRRCRGRRATRRSPPHCVVATLAQLVGRHRHRAPPGAGRSVGDRLRRDRRLLGWCSGWSRPPASGARRSRSRCSASSTPPSPARWPGPTSASSCAAVAPLGWAQGFGILFDDFVAALCTAAGDRAVEVRLSTAGVAAQVERLAAVLRRGGDADRDRRVLHRRPDRRRLHLARRLERLVRARLRHLLERRQERDARRAGGADRGARRGQRRGGVRHGRRARWRTRGPRSRSRSPASPGRAAARPPSRWARSGSASRRAARRPSPPCCRRAAIAPRSARPRWRGRSSS